MINDKRAILQVLGNLMINPSLMEEFPLDSEDFSVEEFHLIVFSCIYNLYASGANKIDTFAIDSYLAGYDKQYAIFNFNNGIDYCDSAVVLAEEENFIYYYNRLRKVSYIRALSEAGVDTAFIYDDTVVDPALQEAEMARLDNYTIESIAEAVAARISTINAKYINNMVITGQLAGKGMFELKEKLKKEPEIGIPTQSKLFNSIVRGARLKKFYLRSGNTGSGKTRTGMGDICSYSIPWFYNLETKSWEYTGFSCPSAFISTEIEIEDCQTLIMAYVSGVDESHICDGKYIGGDVDEEARVNRAIEYVNSAPLYIIYMEDFDLEDIEHIIRKYKHDYGVQYFAFDYIQNSMKMMLQMNKAAGGRGLREDQILLLASAQLKTLAMKLDVHIDSFTQVNSEYANVKEKNQNIIAGGKAIANKIDVGTISLAPSKIELETVRKKVLSHRIGCPEPNLIYHVYKVRKGKLSRIMIWLYADLGTCRTTDLFVTDLDFNLIPVEQLTIENIDATLNRTDLPLDQITVSQEEQEEALKKLIF